jgi:hypothetical protein
MLYFGWETSWKVSTWKSGKVGKLNFSEIEFVYKRVDSSGSYCAVESFSINFEPTVYIPRELGNGFYWILYSHGSDQWM